MHKHGVIQMILHVLSSETLLHMLLSYVAVALEFRGPRPLGPKEIDGLLVPPGKACSLLTDHLITG